MDGKWVDPLAMFNRLYREMDEIYHVYAKRRGISDTAFWLFYSLYGEQISYTQRELCAAWHYPPQTINSALKSLEKQGLIALEPIPGNQKNKQIVLTADGRALAEQVISPLILAELQAFQAMPESQRTLLLELTQNYVQRLQAAVQNISSEN